MYEFSPGKKFVFALIFVFLTTTKKCFLSNSFNAVRKRMLMVSFSVCSFNFQPNHSVLNRSNICEASYVGPQFSFISMSSFRCSNIDNCNMFIVLFVQSRWVTCDHTLFSGILDDDENEPLFKVDTTYSTMINYMDYLEEK